MKNFVSAFDATAWTNIKRADITFSIGGDSYTIHRSSMTGDLKFLWEIMACRMDWSKRSLGSGPFTPAQVHARTSDYMLMYSIPKVYTTGFYHSLVESRKQAFNTRVEDERAAAVLSVDAVIENILRLDPDQLTTWGRGWDFTEYGDLHGGGTASWRFWDQLVRAFKAAGRLLDFMTLLENTVVGRAEVRLQTFMVKHATVGINSTQGELCKLSIHNSNFLGKRHPGWMSDKEKRAATSDSPDVEVREWQDESRATRYVIEKVAAARKTPRRWTGVIMAVICLWSDIVRTIRADNDNFYDHCEYLRRYDPTARVWASVWSLLVEKEQGKTADACTGLTNSQIYAAMEMPSSLFRNAHAGMVPHDKSDEMIESKHKLRHMYMRKNNLFRDWGNCISRIQKAKHALDSTVSAAAAQKAANELDDAVTQRKECVTKAFKSAMCRSLLVC